MLRLLLAAGSAAIAIAALAAAPLAWAGPSSQAKSGAAKPQAKHRKQVGKASFYAKKFAGRKMADGTRMDPMSDNAASKTLPLGSRARVTNLETGASAEVTIRDNGPHVPGRIIDLSPATAEQIGLTRKKGLARVEVTPQGRPDTGPASPAMATD